MWRFAPLVASNLRRRPARTAFTIGSIVIAFLMFGLLGALGHAFSIGAQLAGVDRLLTIHKVSLVQPLPESYGPRIRRVDGVAAVSSATWFGGVYQDERNQIPVFPVDPAVYLEIYPEFIIEPAARERFLAERRGALVGRPLAEQFGWKVGDVIPMRSNIWRKADGSDTWELLVTGIFDVPDTGGDARSVIFHHDYFSESLGRGQGLVGWYVVQLANPDDAARVAREIDEQFANSPYETETSTEKAFAQGFVNQVGNIGAILTGVLSAVFFTMLLVTANTMAQSVRERTAELGVLKTLGFTGRGVTALVLAESVLLTMVGGLVGLVCAWFAVGASEAALQGYLPAWYIPGRAYAEAIGLMVLLGVLAGAAPAVYALRLPVVEALRRA